MSNENSIRVLSVANHPVVLEGVRSYLCGRGRFSVVGSAHSGEEALAKAAKLAPDVVLMDFAHGGINGPEATLKLRHSCPGAKVVMFVDREEKESLQEMIQAGAKGCIPKTASSSELAHALEKVHNGENSFSPEVARMFLDDLVRGGGHPSSQADHKTVTVRERQVLTMVVAGAANKDIADSLKISIRTVEKHRQRLMKKFDLHKATDLVRFAITRKLVDVSAE